MKTWHVLRYLAGQGHRISLASFVRPEEEAYVEKLRRVCPAIYGVPLRRSRLADAGFWLQSQFTGRPFLVERDDILGMRKLLDHLLAEEDIDVIHADQLTMAQFAHRLQRQTQQDTLSMGGLAAKQIRYVRNKPHDRQSPALIFDAHNAVWTILARLHETAPWLLKPLTTLECRRMKRYEGEIVHAYDHTLAVTEPDRTALIEATKSGGNSSQDSGNKITVVPIAVDTERIRPVERRTGCKNIFTLGTLHYPPNADGVRWLLQEVIPLVRRAVPEATLTIAGKNPPRDFIRQAELHPDTITVTGYVTDLTPLFSDAALVVVPVRAGGGMRVRILEAFARGMPVVTTTVGLEGIDAKPGKDVLLGDTPGDFAAAVIRLLKDPDLQANLGLNCRRLAEMSYDWQVVLKPMGELYQAIERQRSKLKI